MLFSSLGPVAHTPRNYIGMWNIFGRDISHSCTGSLASSPTHNIRPRNASFTAPRKVKVGGH